MSCVSMYMYTDVYILIVKDHTGHKINSVKV